MNHPRLLSVAVLIGALLLNAGCLRKRNYTPMNKNSLRGSGKLYLVPLGDFPADVASKLASFYRNKYQLQIETLPNVPLSEAVMNPDRHQLIAEEVVEVMKQAHPNLKNDSQAILIGLTTRDMYIARYDWQFSFSWRDQGKYAVVSSGRMHLPNGRQKVSEELILTRLRKMVTKNVGILYYHLPPSDNPRSVLYRDIGGISELDYMGEDF
jgi:predicted Zn-dependent protease